MDSNNRTAPVASTRVAGKASFVQLQNCLVMMISYLFLLRCQRQYVYLGLVIRNASFTQLQNCLVTMALYSLWRQRQHSYFGQFRCVPYWYLFLSKFLTWPLFTLEKLCGFTLNQPLISVLCSNIKCVSEPCPNGFPYFPDASDLCSASRWCKIILESCFRILCWVNKHSVCYLPRLSKSILRSAELNQYSNSVNS